MGVSSERAKRVTRAGLAAVSIVSALAACGDASSTDGGAASTARESASSSISPPSPAHVRVDPAEAADEVREILEIAHVVASGRVAEIVPVADDGIPRYRVQVDVLKVLKGEASGRLSVLLEGVNQADVAKFHLTGLVIVSLARSNAGTYWAIPNGYWLVPRDQERDALTAQLAELPALTTRFGR